MVSLDSYTGTYIFQYETCGVSFFIGLQVFVIPGKDESFSERGSETILNVDADCPPFFGHDCFGWAKIAKQEV